MLRLYNSLTRQIEEFNPINPPNVGMYTCGPTVYDYTHIGHGRKYVSDDILRRVLRYNGYQVKHVQNITDVGHLSSDADEGEDKLEKGARKTGKTVWEVADYFTQHFYKTMEALNNLRPDVICKATDHISEQVRLIKNLVKKGYAYDTPEAVYYNISQFDRYGKLFNQELQSKKVAVREEVETGKHKRNPQDFVLWFKRIERFKNHSMYWASPWGDGFPGWHIECSAMSMKYLGETIDIHTGGVDHLSIHHPNEIAQSEAATNKQFAKYWVHHNFLLVNGEKMSKSLGNIYTLEDVRNKKFDPLALRYFYFSAHYQTIQNFTWQALEAAQNALNRLREKVPDCQSSVKSTKKPPIGCAESEEKFLEAVNSDLNMPKALSVVWETMENNLPDSTKLATLLKFDSVLGLKLAEPKRKTAKVPVEIQKLLDERAALRQKGDYQAADTIRDKIILKGFLVEDKINGSIIK